MSSGDPGPALMKRRWSCLERVQGCRAVAAGAAWAAGQAWSGAGAAAAAAAVQSPRDGRAERPRHMYLESQNKKNVHLGLRMAQRNKYCQDI